MERIVWRLGGGGGGGIARVTQSGVGFRSGASAPDDLLARGRRAASRVDASPLRSYTETAFPCGAEA